MLVAVPYDAFADKLTSAIPRGNGPDLFIYPHDRIGDWADAGMIEPIEFWVDDARADRFSERADRRDGVSRLAVGPAAGGEVARALLPHRSRRRRRRRPPTSCSRSRRR